MEWYFLGGLAMAFAFLATRGAVRRRSQEAAADASGLVPVGDLTHIPGTLQRTALWALADGGFERRCVHGVISRGAEDVDVTAFDLETLRERRGEWAYLPVDPPFRIGGVVSVVVCEIDRVFPHVLLKREGRGDDNADDDLLERAGSLAKVARQGMGLPRSYAAELPPTLAAGAAGADAAEMLPPLDVALPAQWRAYGDRTALDVLVGAGLGAVLERAGRRDLVIELLDSLVVAYPAAREAAGADAFADLTATALAFVDGVLASSPRISPRGVDPQRPA